jgi:hypothetical protein
VTSKPHETKISPIKVASNNRHALNHEQPPHQPPPPSLGGISKVGQSDHIEEANDDDDDVNDDSSYARQSNASHTSNKSSPQKSTRELFSGSRKVSESQTPQQQSNQNKPEGQVTSKSVLKTSPSSFKASPSNMKNAVHFEALSLNDRQQEDDEDATTIGGTVGYENIAAIVKKSVEKAISTARNQAMIDVANVRAECEVQLAEARQQVIIAKEALRVEENKVLILQAKADAEKEVALNELAKEVFILHIIATKCVCCY